MDVGFTFGTTRARAAAPQDRASLMAFCRANPAYDVFLTGELPDENEWVDDFLNDLPPAAFGWSATHKLIATDRANADAILAIIDVSEDMLAKGVGHIGMFQVDESLHGSGFAHELYRALEGWLAQRGSDVIRLGVLEGNPRGLSFWTRQGYHQTRRRIGTAPTGKTHNSFVMYKPLMPLNLEAYRMRVPRDHPDTI
jgi:ribosomal protein S18 acetylase RimI-like enzyme